MKVLVRRGVGLALSALLAVPVLGHAAAHAAATTAPITGEIERITLDNPTDVWSGGTIVVGGQNVTLPRNLLMDLPANRLTLQQLFMQAPAACRASGESGLAKADRCNRSGTGGIATIAANRTTGGNLIAGDVFVEKGLDAVSGVVTFVNHDEGYFRLDGNPGDDTTGVMVRLNDPTGRHTVQLGTGCAGGPNCSPDPRFTEDPDNYTNTFSTGYPLCIPSTVKRTFADTLDFDNDPSTTTLDAQAAPDGTGDVLCPVALNRAGAVAGDSRRLAPIVPGDHLTATGNFETVDGVRFLSAWKTTVSAALATKPDAGQPDYIFLDEAFIDAPGFQNQRVRALFAGFATLDTDVLLWSIHRDPVHNAPHELPLATVVGCDNAAGPGTCGRVGLAPGNTIWKINLDVDFRTGARPKLSPCAHLRADSRFSVANPCPGGGTLAEMFSVLSPMPHEIIGRSGRKLADLNGAGVLRTLDLKGADSPNGQYLFPFGIGLGGIDIPFAPEFNLNALATPFSFSGIPWNLDRRLSPGGCTADPCETTPQPLEPFPFEVIDPRTQAAVPTAPSNDPVFTHSPLTNTANRILSFVDGARAIFDGDSTVLAWPPADPPAVPIRPTPALPQRGDFVMGVTPDSGPVGTRVVVDGTNLAGATGVSFGGVPADPATVANLDDFHVSAVVPTGAMSGPVGVTTGAGSLPTSARFGVIPAPTIAGFTPASGPTGSTIAITGTGLTTALDVAINGASTTFSVLSDAAIRAVVPSSATSGTITVTSVGGTATSAAAFTVDAPPASPPAPPPAGTTAPAISGFTPTNGPAGTAVTITGSGFTGASAVDFNGTTATFTVDSDTSITTTVPSGATTGPIGVTTPAGSASSPSPFTVDAAPQPAPTPAPAPASPTITGVAPASGPPGTSVTLTGTGFTGATAVAFNGVSAPFTVGSDTTITTTAPSGATTGPIRVTTPAGTATSSSGYAVSSPAPPPPPPPAPPSSGGSGTSSPPPPPATNGGAGGSSGGAAATSANPPAPAAPSTSLARVAGDDRLATAIAASRDAFAGEGSAAAVVLAGASGFADALAGTPLAAAHNGPLLLNPGDHLDPAVAAEIGRVLQPAGTVSVLGGEVALRPAVVEDLRDRGYHVVRYGGANRYQTAVRVADALGAPSTVLEATGTDFADAVTAGAAAAHVDGVVLLTDGGRQAPETARWLAAHPAATRYAIGGAAASADPDATPLAGADRFETATLVARALFTSPSAVGLASGRSFADALAGGADIAATDGPMLLVPATGALPAGVRSYLESNAGSITVARVYGGASAVDDDVVDRCRHAVGA